MSILCKDHSRARDHEATETKIETLHRENPGATPAEIYDLVSTAGYDLDKARRLAAEAKAEAMRLCDYLALYECEEVRE